MKRVVFSAPYEIKFEEAPDPQRGPGEALLQVRYVGICGSDLHTYRGSSTLARYPVIPGHELCCEVLESEGTLSPGVTVVVEPLLACGVCYPCRVGRYNCCEALRVLGVQTDGGMAERISLPLKNLHPLPATADPSCGPLVETLSIGFHACKRARIGKGDRVLVIGAGPIGLGAALVAQDKGAEVGILDRLDARLHLAQEVGIDLALRPEDGWQGEVVRRFDGQPHVVIEAVGSPRTLEEAIEVVSAAGRVVFVGWTSESPSWRPDLFLKKELELLGSRNSCGVFPEVIEFYCRHLVKLKRMVTHRYKMERVGEAMRLLDTAGGGAMKVILEW